MDVQQEYNRLTALYRKMADDELEAVAAEAYDLTEIAREVLASEISSRGLRVTLNLTPPSSDDADLPPTDDGFVPDDRDLARVYLADTLSQLAKIKHILDESRIECFLGEDRLHEVGALRQDTELSVCVWKPEYERAYALLCATVPGYKEESEQQAPDAEVRCPKCKSDAVILEEVEGDRPSTSKYRWACDDCGHEWEDDGVAGAAPSPSPAEI